ncbi:MAG: nucleotidyltransferase family protein [Bacteroidales bacterium]|nr:nucleotidyltransferase family protein [Bacteroidales bacterium]
MITANKSAMILAAGLGSRLKELTVTTPKALIEINGVPLLKIIINKLKNNGFNHIVINVHHHAEQIKAYLKDNSYFETNIEISDEKEQLLDTGGAILKALPLFADSDAVLVHNVDIVSDVDLTKFYQSFLQSKMDARLMCRNRESNRKFLISSSNRLIGWKNFQTGEIKMTDSTDEDYEAFSFSGIHIFRPQLFSGIALKKCSIIDIYLQLARSKRIDCKIIDDGYWFDLGKKEDFEKISLLLKQH